MLPIALLSWWYGKGWADTGRNIQRMVLGISRLFSVPILMRTLFAPWKRIISYPGASLDAKLRAYGDNIVSRMIGFIVRLLVLLTAFATGGIVLALGIISVVLWPLVPLLIIGLLIKGIIG